MVENGSFYVPGLLDEKSSALYTFVGHDLCLRETSLHPCCKVVSFVFSQLREDLILATPETLFVVGFVSSPYVLVESLGFTIFGEPFDGILCMSIFPFCLELFETIHHI